MATQEIERLEKLLSISVQDVCIYTGLKVGKVYYQRKKFPKVYKAMLIGMRILSSELTVREIVSQIEPIEKIISKKNKQ